MAFSMNPVDLYRDSSLDDAVLQNTRLRENGDIPGKSKEFRSDSLSNGQDTNTTGYDLSESSVPKASLISYRGVDPNVDPKMHRSFSQRAKGRPFAEEAFADEFVEDDDGDETADAQLPPAKPAMKSPLQSTTAPVVDQSTAPYNRSVSEQAPDSNKTIPRAPRSTGSKAKPEPAPDQTPMSRSATLRDAANQTEDQLQSWAPDRSPLQKLEVKLTDISKEEKRARVQEAEMRLREAQASLKGRGTQVANNSIGSSPEMHSPRVPSQRAKRQPGTSHRTVSLDDTPRVIVTSDGSQRSRAPVSLHNQTTQDGAPRQIVSTSQKNAVPVPKQRTNSQVASSPRTPTNRGSIRSASLKQANNNSIAIDEKLDQVQRAVSLQQRRPQGSARAIDRPISERERNASHQAALQQLVGEPSLSEKVRSDNATPRRSQQTKMSAQREKSAIEGTNPVLADIGTLAGEDLVFNNPSPNTPRQSKAMSLLGTKPGQSSDARDSVGGQAATSSTPTAVNASESIKGRQRRSSVSFKEPFDRRRPVDEWRNAETARLTAEDFSTEAPAEPEVYKAWWERDQSKKGSRARAASTHGPPTAKATQIDDKTATFDPPLYLKCGPLLRYSGLKRIKAEVGNGTPAKEFWRGTVMIVTQDSRCSYDELPTLKIFSRPKRLLPPPPALVAGGQLAPEYVDPIAGLTKLSRTGRAIYVRPIDHLDEARDLSRLESDDGIYEASPSPLDTQGNKTVTSAATNDRTTRSDGELLGRYKEVKGVRIYADPDRDVTFWRFNIEVELGSEQQHIAYRINKSAAVGFWVPARGHTMNMMFHTCNGFSIAVDTNSFSGPDPLWRDVLNNHQHRPFHVMIGGGDQVYNDRAMVDTQHFAEWTKLKNPHHKHQALFTPEMKEELETFYLNRYMMWFSQGLFGMANSSIPMINVWDDHDIIDGFGSYPDEFMKSPVFCGLGSIAYKYYLLFQHQTIEPMTDKEEPSWILGHSPGPYIKHASRSLYMELGQHVGFLGMDCRTERTRDDVLSIDTLELILDRCRREMIEGQTKHLIVLLGVPIAYPRLVWLENMLTSKILDPVKALGRAGIIKTKLLNRFDGGVEILDDLDDHWTASHHKDERNILIQELQDLAAEKSARVTILSGDVHLAAIGQFYSNPKLKIPKDHDHRYMPNVISSAIVNTPPPDLLADVLNKRNKVHHLDKYTDENMIPMFSHDVDNSKRNNNHLLPRRNWCSIREYLPGDTPPPSPSLSATDTHGSSVPSADEEPVQQRPQGLARRLSLTKQDFNPRTLLRRLSSRGEPPTSYRDSTDQIERRRASFDDAEPDQRKPESLVKVPQYHPRAANQVPEVPALRPSFHRRPTNLSEKAVKKGNVLAMDAEGNEVDVNDHINLQGGLDIVINCEINQKDPAGITTPYRLLVPALWYDGSSDRDKLVTAPPLNRTGSLLNKLGFSTRRSQQVVSADEANARNAVMSETESDEMTYDGQAGIPKRRFSLFGSRRKRPSDGYEHDRSHEHERAQIRAEPEPPSMPQAPAAAMSQNRFANTTDTRDVLSSRKPQEPSQNKVKYTELPADSPAESPRIQPSRPVTHKAAPSFSSQRSSQRSTRPMSYTIGGNSERPPIRSEYSSTEQDGRPPYDPDAAYVLRQHQNTKPNNPPRYSRDSQARQNHGSSLESTGDHYEQAPPRPLRGNGIIGKNVPPTSFRSSYENNRSQEAERGYSGIEAYKDPKPRRRWSLKEKARNIIGRRSSEEWYSDEEEEQYWEGPKRT